jgi:type II secretory pathway pseudopilin PulG
MRRRLRRQGGFTMVEVLVVLFSAGVVIGTAATAVDVVLNQSTGTVLRTDATQRGRLVLDRMTQQLRSQVCLDVGTATERISLVAASANSVRFYVDLGDGSKPLSERRLSYDPASKTIVQQVWPANSAVGAAPTTFSNTAQSTTLLDNVIPYADGSTPIFSYFGYQPTGDPRLDTLQFDPGAGMLSTAQLEDTARIAVAMEVLPARAPDQTISTRLEDSVHLRTSDPNQESPDPTCR